MADDEQFSLCWNNFNTNLSAGFHESLCREDLVDVSLAAEGQIVKAHRLVLSVCSPFFRKMFTQMPTNTHAIVFLNNVSHSALKDLIQFMYCGEVNVKQDALPAFISTAESLQIKGLTDNDPTPQAPPEPTPPPPASPHVQQVPAQRVQQRQQRAPAARYKIETVDDVMGDDKGTTQIVIQTTAPQATIVQQQPQHIQTQQQVQTANTTTATLVSTTNKRTAQRLSGSSNVKRSKTNTTNVTDPLDSSTETATTATNAQLAPQQITVQTTVVQAARQQTQQAAAQSDTEFIDLPIELPTKSEPDYTEEHGEVAGDGETTYVEDDAYGDMRYDDSYFTENEDAGAQTTGNTSGGNMAATTSKAVIKQQTSQSYSDTSFVDTGGEQGNTEAQEPKPKRTLNTGTVARPLALVQRGLKCKVAENLTIKPMRSVTPPTISNAVFSIATAVKTTRKTALNLNNPENILQTSSKGHNFVFVKKPRLKGQCVNCLKNGKSHVNKVNTFCDTCPGGNWMCQPCFVELHIKL